MTTSEPERARLLQIARRAIEDHVSRQAAVGNRQSAVGSQQPEDVERDALAGRRAGVFVTIYHAGELRGCIGHIEADRALPDSVARCAVAACSEDPRFPAVSALELPEIRLEISVLGPMEPVGGPGDVEIGRHGLLIEMGRHRGLLLPQVATEREWDAATFLSQTCRKAGLASDSWRHGADVWRFEADVFGDEPAH
jgi:AmmeMemoRadiSam system protein A